MKRWVLFATVLMPFLAAPAAQAADINILWYTGGTQPLSGTYAGNINNLITTAATAPEIAVHNNWSITYWTGGPKPAGTFNALVVASHEGSWSSYPDYAALTSALGAGDLGNRKLVTGQDADWHYQNYPGPSAFNNPAGFLVDAINWAGSGTGMGAVFLSPGEDVLNAFFGLTLGTGTVVGNDTVIIPGPYASYPINEGLTTAGLSNWFSSDHDIWTGFDTSIWTAINTDGFGNAVTLVSADTASGGTSGGDSAVPEPGSLILAGMGIIGLGGYVQRRRRQGLTQDLLATA